MNKQIALGFFLIAILALVSVWVLIQFSAIFATANSSVQASIIAGAVALISLISTRWMERTKAVSEAHREKKVEVYSEFFDIVFDAIRGSESFASEDDKPNKESPIVRKLASISRGALFYGSPKVVLALSNWQLTSAMNNDDPAKILRSIGSILLAMRSDIGLSNRGLDELSIHQIYVNDDLKNFGKKI